MTPNAAPGATASGAPVAPTGGAITSLSRPVAAATGASVFSAAAPVKAVWMPAPAAARPTPPLSVIATGGGGNDPMFAVGDVMSSDAGRAQLADAAAGGCAVTGGVAVVGGDAATSTPAAPNAATGAATTVVSRPVAAAASASISAAASSCNAVTVSEPGAARTSPAAAAIRGGGDSNPTCAVGDGMSSDVGRAQLVDAAAVV